MCIYICILLLLLGKEPLLITAGQQFSKNITDAGNSRRIAASIVFYAVHVISRKVKRLVLPRMTPFSFSFQRVFHGENLKRN
jgi:hypothetical protein